MIVADDVSVAVCTHNGAKFIEEQIQSILTQTILPGEIVVSDDASSDGTVELLEKTIDVMAKVNSDLAKVKLHILRNEHALGVTGNFETCLAQTHGRFIFLSDQDDIWQRNKIERILEVFGGSARSRFVFGDADLITETGESLGHSLFDALAISKGELNAIVGTEPLRTLMRRNIVTGATTAFTRDIFEAARPFPTAWLHDEWLSAVAALMKAQFIVTESLTEYRQHSTNQVGVKKLTLVERVNRLTAPGRMRNARLLERAQQISIRSADLNPSYGDSRLITEALNLQRARSKFPRFRLVRWLWVIPQMISMRYWTVSNGLRDILRDLVQPL